MKYAVHSFLAADVVIVGILGMGFVSIGTALRMFLGVTCVYVITGIVEVARRPHPQPKPRFITAIAQGTINNGDILWVDTDTHKAQRVDSQGPVQ